MANRVIKNHDYLGDVIEVAPGDRFVSCDFRKCEFVGLGPATFTRCHFDSCDTSRIAHRRRVEFEKCTGSFSKE